MSSNSVFEKIKRKGIDLSGKDALLNTFSNFKTRQLFQLTEKSDLELHKSIFRLG